MDESHSQAASAPALLSASQAVQQVQVVQVANGICYATLGETQVAREDLERILLAVPTGVAGALNKRAYYFVPLTIYENEEISVAPDYTTELADRAICHRNFHFGSSDVTFVSTRIMQDRFALAFEFFINAGHHFVESVGVPESFCEVAWPQAESMVRGETSHDAWEYRQRALAGDEKAKTQFFEAAFADALAIYMLAMTVDFDYLDLREREYPLLAAPALAERLRHVAGLFPPNAGYEFEIRYKRRS